MDKALAMGVLRHVLQLAAGALVARGILDAGTAETAIGGVLSLATVAWYLAGRRGAR